MSRVRALIVVDVQNDFCEGGSLAVAGGSAVAAQIHERVLERPFEYDLVAATKDYHVAPEGHFSDTPDFRDTWPPHCVAGTAGAEFRAPLTEELFDVVFYKGAYAPAYSGFEGVTDPEQQHGFGLEQYLRLQDVVDVVVVGVATDYCVRATALDARKAGFDVTVDTRFTAGVAEETTAAAIAEMEANGIRCLRSSVDRAPTS